MPFTEPPVSKKARNAPAKLVCRCLPMHPEYVLRRLPFLRLLRRNSGDNYADQMEAEDLELCHNFHQYRQLLEDYSEHPNRVFEMSDKNKEGYELAE
ncbi:hypothetical protein GCK32_006709, partial [Trichostrongylus colubriformis]